MLVNGDGSTDMNSQPMADAVEPSVDAEVGITALQNELDRVRAEADRSRDEMLRARAELDNVRKRAQRDVEAAHKYGIERLVEALIPVKDSLDLGVEAANSTDDIKGLQDGMALTVRLFEAALEKIGVAVIDPTGTRFDPEQHQAMMTEPSVEVEPGTVLRVMQKAYLLHGRVVRPAMVVVARAP